MVHIVAAEWFHKKRMEVTSTIRLFAYCIKYFKVNHCTVYPCELMQWMHGCCFCRCWLLFFFSLKDNIISVTFGTFSCFLSRSTQSFWLIHSLLSLQKTKKIVVDQYQNQYFETHKIITSTIFMWNCFNSWLLKIPQMHFNEKQKTSLGPWVSVVHDMKSKGLQRRAVHF